MKTNELKVNEMPCQTSVQCDSLTGQTYITMVRSDDDYLTLDSASLTASMMPFEVRVAPATVSTVVL